MSIEYTKEEYEEFDRLLTMTESQNQLMRIEGRLGLNQLINKLGKAKCDAIFVQLMHEFNGE